MDLQQEASIFGKFLLGEMPDAKSITLYVDAQTGFPISGSTQEQKILNFAIRHAWLIGALDGALALSRPNALLRRKLLVMSAILETRPQYAHLFLPRERSFFYLFVIGWKGATAILKAVFGKLILGFIA
ncbi:MAG: hypothetical protein ACRCYO_02480 [Bacteroidia bacterium]